MITIDGLPVLADEYDILVELRQQVLDQQGREILRKIKRTGNNIMVCCPVHNDGQERKPSCGISTVDGKESKAGTVHCFDIDTEIITYEGIKTIREILGIPVQILNGNGEWEYTIFKHYGKQELYKLNLHRNGVQKTILTTGEHLWKVRSRQNYTCTKDLIPNQRMAKVVPNPVNLQLIPQGVRHGFIFGDGGKISANVYKAVFFTKQKQQLMNSIFFKDCRKPTVEYEYPRLYVDSPDQDLKELPKTKDLNYLYSFIVGWFAADGNVTSGGCTLCNYKKEPIEFLENVLPRLGIAHFGKKYRKRPAGTTYCDYNTELWTLAFAINTLPENFFIREHKQTLNRQCKYDKLGWVVKSVEPTGIIKDVYCCETTTHTFALKDFLLTHNCFACGYVDTFEGLISKCFGYEGEDFGRTWLLENFVTGESGDRPPLNIDVSRDKKIEKPTYITEEELASYRQFYHDYMWQRKLTPEIVDKYDVGYQPDFRLVTKNEDGTETVWPPIECLTFPVRDINGNTLFVSRRAIHNKNFFLPPDMEKPVYGIYELPKNCKEVVICESVFNALTCVAYGRPAVALFGTGTSYQYEQLKQLGCRKYILGLDPDKAGNKGSWKLKRALRGNFITKLIIPPGKDINDLSYEEFWRLPEIMF